MIQSTRKSFLFCISLFILSVFLTHYSYAQVWSGLSSGTDADVKAMVVYNNQLIVGGAFTYAGGQNVNHIASWDGTNWAPLGVGTNDVVFALGIYDDQLVAVGRFTTAGGIACNRIATWNGYQWSPLGSGLNNDAYAVAQYGNALVVGGIFTNAGGITYVSRIASWNSSTGWSAMNGGVDNTVYALATFGNYLYAGGSFIYAGGSVQVKRVGRWNGANWSACGVGFDDGQVNAIGLMGSNYIAVGGTFTTIGGTIVNRIADWNGYSWFNMGIGFNAGVNAVFSPAGDLYAGGDFVYVNGNVPASHVAYWNSGSGWSPLGTGISGTNATVYTIASLNGNIVYGGHFTSAGGVNCSNIAQWGAPLGIVPVSGETPSKFSLSQNYPNPFNPSTKIRFDIAKASNVSLAIYDVTGKEVGVIVNENFNPGTYEFAYDASQLSSGVYFYKLVTAGFTDVKRMVLLK